MLSQMGPTSNTHYNGIDMLDMHDFDNNNQWDQNIAPPHLHQIATKFIEIAKKGSSTIDMIFYSDNHVHA